MPPFRPLGRTRLRAERLEDRATPALWNNPWPESDRITMSFAEDGKEFADGTKSELYTALGSSNPVRWQDEFLRAAQTWAAVANLNIGVVHDTGKPFDQVGPLQGSFDYGDIRVGARSLPADQLAYATPFDLLDAGAGDIIVNKDKSFSVGGANGTHDIYTVALQEIGHALGLPNNPEKGSAMYTQYWRALAGPSFDTPEEVLSASDIQNIQAIYGARGPDRFEGTLNNNEAGRAAPVQFLADADSLRNIDPTAGPTPFVAAGHLTAGDADYYKVRLPHGNDFSAQVRTAGVSNLVAKVSVVTLKYNSTTGKTDEVLLASGTGTDPRSPNGDVRAFVSGLTAGKDYYIKVQAAGRAGFTTGAYRLNVGRETNEALNPQQYSGWMSQDFGANNTLGSATDLGVRTLDNGPKWEWTTRASIDAPEDKDFYKFTTSGTANQAAIITVWALEVNKLDPQVRVYGPNNAPLTVEVLGNDASTASVQVRGLQANTTYRVEVAATNSGSSYNIGNYFVGMDLRSAPIELHLAKAGTLTESAKQWAGEFEVTAARDFHFQMAVGAVTGPTEAAVRMTVYDSTGRAVATFVTKAGETVGLDVDLAPGKYRVKVSGGAKSGAMPTLTYSLKMLVRNDPIGPGAADPTDGPTGTNPPPPTVAPFSTTGWVFWVDDFSDPWSGV